MAIYSEKKEEVAWKNLPAHQQSLQFAAWFVYCISKLGNFILTLT